MAAPTTPMMRQYKKIKQENPDSLVLFRLGDFYELFGEDAKIGAKELELTLTTRDKGKKKEDQMPMCGVPYHACDSYISRLIAKGYKVAICEQMEDASQASGLVSREVVRTITPGTVIDSTMLEEGRSNFISAVYRDENNAAVCFIDMSTGQTLATSFSGDEVSGHIINELSRFSPSEVLLGGSADARVLDHLKGSTRCETGMDALFELSAADEMIAEHYGKAALSAFPKNDTSPRRTVGALLQYLRRTQKRNLEHINRLEYYGSGEFMELDPTARRNLELTETLYGKTKRGSLLWVLDKTRTPMGSRCLRGFLERPLLDPAAIEKRQMAVAPLVEHTMAREELSVALKGVGDMERLIGRIVYGTAGGRDLVQLRNSIEKLPEIAHWLGSFKTGPLGALARGFDALDDIGTKIAEAIGDEPPVSVHEGKLIRQGYHEEVDRLRDIMGGGKNMVIDLETREKEKTGIRTLKVKYNRVFGYYIEVSNSFKDQVPEHYVRRQTLANAERYVTDELKDLEHTILTASDRVAALEYELFLKLRREISDAAPRIQKTASDIAELDAYVSLALVAVRQGYVCPIVDESGVIEIRSGRHPVVEQLLTDTLFVPNDTTIGETEGRTAIITGPNMAGKSTYMRQVALIVLMAQIGSFVPANSAHIGVVDRIFTRIGASDDLGGGRSTFMVEMSEVAQMLEQATSRSLLILDEIGRGTSTFDGMSIARAVLEHCADRSKLGAKTLFATHYHELTDMEQTLGGVTNYCIAVKARGDEISFLRKIVRGGADRSYGIEVAKMAGIPDSVLRRAREILLELEREGGAVRVLAQPEPEPQDTLIAPGEQEALEMLRRTQVEVITPMEALNLLNEMKLAITRSAASDRTL